MQFLFGNNSIINKMIKNGHGTSPNKRKCDILDQTTTVKSHSSNEDSPSKKHKNGSTLHHQTFSMTSTRQDELGIDEGLYSRMLYVVGTDGFKKLASSSVVIVGMDGLGAEIAKNTILGGVNKVCLCDDKIITEQDLGTHFFFEEKDIGKYRAEVTKSKMSELNSYVQVEYLNHFPQSEVIQNYDVTVLCNAVFDYEKQVSNFCHQMNIKFISVRTFGLTGRIFCDFGNDFVVIDPTGRLPGSSFVLNVTKEKESVVTVSDEQRHGFEDGTIVKFTDVKGMTELMDKGPFKIKYISPYTFSIGDTSEFESEFTGTACVTEIIQPITLNFKSMSEAIEQPTFVEYDFAKFDYPSQLHLSYLALAEFFQANNSLPSSYNDQEALTLLKIAQCINEKLNLVDKVNETIVKNVANTCRGQIAPLMAVIGGIASQEIMKACTHKFTPIQQFFYFESFECLPDSSANLKLPVDINCRYFDQSIVLGQDFLNTALEANLFVVGMGALGCEILKCLALMGIGCSPNGQITITDMDTIGKSNLNRQFLFRPWDIGKMKTEIAAKAIRSINPAINIICHQNKVSSETESIYNDAFFNRLNCVMNALDNIQTRTYVDLRCVYYQKPLLESGTLGTRANSQVVLPHLTESYSSSHDPPEKSIPMCTLKNFPHAIEHTIQWARDSFEEMFYCAPMAAKMYLKDVMSFVEQIKRPDADSGLIRNALTAFNLLSKPLTNFEDCVRKARNLFEDFFTNQIKQLVFNFPRDMKTTQAVDFWFAPKKFPHHLTYNPIDKPSHGDFVFTSSNLFAAMFNIPQETDRNKVLEMANEIEVASFIPQAGVKIAVSDAEAEALDKDGSLDKNKILADLISLGDSVKKIQIEPLEFEKDDDDNFHIDFITACSNLRAENYDIEQASRLQTKKIAGKIIPAIATTTSAVVGLICLELIKILQGKSKIELYRNGFFDLADSTFVFSEPVEAKKNKYHDVEFTLWDRIDVQGEMTMREFISYIEEKFDVSISMVSYDVMMLFATFVAKDRREARLNMTISDIIQSIQKKPLEKHVNALVIEVSCEHKQTGEEIELPYIRYILSDRIC